MRYATRRRVRGFTLIELMSVLFIMAIVLAASAPGMSSLLESSRLRAATFDLVADLTMARNESLKRGAGVTVAPTVDADWSNGWQVRVDGGVEVLRDRLAVGGSVQVGGAPASIAFDRNGRLSGGGGVTRIQVDSARFAHASRKRCVTVDPLGRARSAAGACS